MTIDDPQKYWDEKIQCLVGRTIVAVNYLSRSNWAEQFDDWRSVPIVIEFDDGSQLVPMRDDEGNDGGSLMTSIEGLETIPTLSPQHLKR